MDSPLSEPKKAAEFATNSVENKSVLKFIRWIFGPRFAYPLLFLPFYFILYCWVSQHDLNADSLFSNTVSKVDILNSNEIEFSTFQNIVEGERNILAKIHLQNLPYFILAIGSIICVIYYTISKAFDYQFDAEQKNKSEIRNAQLNKSLADLEFEGLVEVCTGICIAAHLLGTLFCYVYNQGPLSKIYYGLSDYPLWWAVLQCPVLLFWQDYIEYWRHRFYHLPLLYKNFHRVHHKDIHPTYFGPFAWHPIEMTHYFLLDMTPLFVVPIHWATIMAIIFYTSGRTLLEHVGIAIKAPWWLPWQPDAIFHDRHHECVNVNFGFHSWFWDALYGTCEQTRLELTPKEPLIKQEEYKLTN